MEKQEYLSQSKYAEQENKSNDDKAPNYWREKALHEKAKREPANWT